MGDLNDIKKCGKWVEQLFEDRFWHGKAQVQEGDRGAVVQGESGPATGP